MSEQPIPRLADIEAAGVTALLGELQGEPRRKRNRAACHGNLADVIAGWLAQAERARRRLVQEFVARRLGLATGLELQELAQSEFFASLPTEAQRAVGTATITRSVTNATASGAGAFTAGAYPKGTRIQSAGDGSRVPALQQATYTLDRAIAFGADATSTTGTVGNYTHVQTASVPVTAVNDGIGSNRPSWSDIDSGQTATWQGQVFDGSATILVEAAGGSGGPTDGHVLALAQALATGRVGPTGSALVAGVLSLGGIRRAVHGLDYARAVAVLFVADESWGSSQQLREIGARALIDDLWLGWGARAEVRGVVNRGVRVFPSILLQETKLTDSDKGEIADAVLAAQASYFDDRQDWFTWSLAGLRGALSIAHPKILTCTSVSVTDRNGSALAEPVTTLDASVSQLTHYYAVSSANDITFTTPS